MANRKLAWKFNSNKYMYVSMHKGLQIITNHICVPRKHIHAKFQPLG